MPSVRPGARPFLRALVLCSIAAALLLSSLTPSSADGGTASVRGVFIDEITGVDMEWEFPYSDSLFTGSALTYSHTLAQASLGMALSAFRRTLETNRLVRQDEQILSFFEQTGFSDPETADYDQEPTLHTVSSVIAHKRMRDEDGEFTLVAAAICGGAYRMEWLSNFTVGNGTRHEGFSRAAQNVEGRIFVYMAERRLTGRLKLWITGYSRAAAVANITAADMSDYGPFGKENVFAYTFATPRTTREAREGSYGNIFNVVGRMDVVPQVPLRGWGYSRYGNDLFLPCRETDSYYALKKPAADAVHLRVTGKSLGSNPELNQSLHTVLDFLLELCPDTGTYTGHMQDVLKDMWEHRSFIRIASDFARLASDPVLVTDENREEADQLMDFMTSLAWDSALGKGSIFSSWSSDVTMAGNLAREHTPAVYIAWLFSSDDPDEIFSTSGSYQRCVVEGDVDLEVYENGVLLMRLTSQGEIVPGEGSAAGIFMTRVNRQSIAILPQDRTYLLECHGRPEGSVRCYCITYDTQQDENSKKGYSVTVSGPAAEGFCVNLLGEDYELPDLSYLSGGTEEERRLAEQLKDAFAQVDHTNITERLNSRASFMYRIEKLNVFRLSWIAIVNIAVALPIVLLLLLLLTVVLGVRHRKKKKARRAGQAA